MNNTNTNNTWRRLKAYALRESRPSRRERREANENANITLAEIMRRKLDNGLSIHEIIERAAWSGGMYNEITGKVIPGHVSNIFFGVPDEVIDIRCYYDEDSMSRIDWNNFFEKHDNVVVKIVDAQGEEQEYDDIDCECDLLDLAFEIDFDYCSINEKYYGTREIIIHAKESGRVYVSELENNEAFNGFTWTHGLAAYSAGQIVEKATDIQNNPQWEICCALMNQPIGPVGLYLEGDAAVVSNIDLYSGFDEKGRYYDCETFRADGIVNSPDEIDEEEWDHCEAIVRNVRVTGIWVKDWYVEKDEATIKELEDKLGFKAVVVEARRAND